MFDSTLSFTDRVYHVTVSNQFIEQTNGTDMEVNVVLTLSLHRSIDNERKRV